MEEEIHRINPRLYTTSDLLFSSKEHVQSFWKNVNSSGEAQEDEWLLANNGVTKLSSLSAGVIKFVMQVCSAIEHWVPCRYPGANGPFACMLGMACMLGAKKSIHHVLNRL